MQKSQVREVARRAGLSVPKKGSTGICFIGERKFKEFLQNSCLPRRARWRTLQGEYIGPHDGLMYYTLGQRRGLNIGGRGTGERWFVVAKDLEKNILYVEQGADSPALYSRALRTEGFNFIAEEFSGERELMAKFRYRQPDQKVLVRWEADGLLMEFAERQRAVTPGQFAVLYDGDECLGGGIIREVLF